MKTLLFLTFFLTAILSAATYTCPMHPQIISEQEGSCPICGMDLVLHEREDLPSIHSARQEARSVVTISAQTVQNMGVKAELVEYADFGRDIHGFGVLSANERTRYDVSSRVKGWIEVLHVDAVGDKVKKGDLLYTLYSPELIEAQNDFLAALRSQKSVRIKASKNRLRTLGIQNQSIKTIQKSKEIIEFVPFYALSNGTVSSLIIAKGRYVTPQMQLMQIEDYSTLWVIASVEEQDAIYLETSTPARITQVKLGNIEYNASVDYIYPEIDTKTRTVKVRLKLDNSKKLLRIGGYVDVIFETDYERRLAVSTDALLYRSDGIYVVIALGDGAFVPRKVKIGLHVRGMTEVYKGLNEGDAIVTSAQFMLDSESAMRDAFSNMTPEKSHAQH